MIARGAVVAMVAACAPARPPPATELERTVDRRVDPCNDFYAYACGGWLASHPIPPDRSSISVYGLIEDADRAKEQAIAEEAAAQRAPADPRVQHVGGYYAACMATAAIEARGLAPLRPWLARIDAMRTPDDVADVVAALHAIGVSVVFDPYTQPDPHDTRRIVLALGAEHRGLPSRDDYLDDTPAATALRARYRDYVAGMLTALGADPAGADAVLALEIELARATPPATELMNPEATVHPTTLGALAAQQPGFAFARYAADLHVALDAPVNVDLPGRLAAMTAHLADLPTVRAAMKLGLARSLSAVLPAAIDDRVFAFEQTTLRGVRARAPRGERCLGMVDDDLGDEMGQLFVARYFPPQSRARADVMVQALVGAMKRELADAAWLDPATRAAAQRKLARVRIMIGQPDSWLDYRGLVIAADDAFGNVCRARTVALHRHLAQVGRPTDRGIWGEDEPAQSLDGFTAHDQMIVGFTAGFLQPPIFDPAEPDPARYGGVGGVIGHELSHHFDSSGRHNDPDGNLRSWWSDADVARYTERQQCFVAQYGRYHTDDGTPVDGARTVNENLADNGGLRLAWNALAPAYDGPVDAAGFTPAQQFFLAWARIRCENVTPEESRRRARSDGHSPGRWRVDGVVSNMPEFARAFACKSGAAMAPELRCRLW